VGDDWYDELRQQWMSENINQRYGKYIEDRIALLGRQAAWRGVGDKLREVRAMIMPSLSENLPYAVLEAMAEGCRSSSPSQAGMLRLWSMTSAATFSHLEMGDMEKNPGSSSSHT
jgi:glycosyltransferase involved in cell wall biosynthesis